MSLDKKLEKIINKWILDLADSYDAVPPRLQKLIEDEPAGDEEWAGLIGQIKVAIAEEGYERVGYWSNPDIITVKNILYIKKIGKERTMTGSEWYTRWSEEVGVFSEAQMKEFTKHPSKLYRYMLSAARRASKGSSDE